MTSNNGDSTEASSGSATTEGDDEMDRLRAENEALKARVQRRLTWRKVLTVLLVVLTSLSVVASTFAFWAHRTLFDTEAFMSTVGPALEDPALYDAVADRVSAEVIEGLNLEERVTERLSALDEFISQALVDALDLDDDIRELLSRFDRPSLADLAPSIAEALETRIDARIHQVITSDTVAGLVPQLVERGHQATVALLRDDLTELPNVYIADGEVRLNLIPIIRDALAAIVDDLRGFLPDIDLPDVVSNLADEGRQQLEEAIGEALPEDFGQVTVMSEEALDQAQASVARLDRYVWALIALSLILAVVTIATSTTRRRTAFQLGLGIVIAITLAALIVRRTETAIVDRIVSPEGDLAARAVLGGVLDSLRRVELIVLIGALVVAVGAYLAGRPAWITRLTSRESTEAEGDGGPSELDLWVSGHFDLLRVVGVGVAVLVLFLVGLDLVPALVIGGILALYLWYLTEARGRVPEPEGEEDEPVAQTSTE